MDINKLLDGHIIVKMTNSGKDWGMNRAGKFSKQQGVSRAWIKKNISKYEYDELMNGETIGITVRRGRGFSYVEYKRVPCEGKEVNTVESNCTIRSVVLRSEQLPDDLDHDPILDGDDPHALGLRP